MYWSDLGLFGGSHFRQWWGLMLDYVGVHFGILLEPHFGNLLEPLLTICGVPVWTICESNCGPFGDTVLYNFGV